MDYHSGFKLNCMSLKKKIKIIFIVWHIGRDPLVLNSSFFSQDIQVLRKEVHIKPVSATFSITWNLYWEMALMIWSIDEIIHIWTAVVDESEEWSSQLNFQFKQLDRRRLKKSGLQRDSNPWPPRYRCDALPTELWSHTLGARSIYWVHISRDEWNAVKYIWNNSYLNCGCRWKMEMGLLNSR